MCKREIRILKSKTKLVIIPVVMISSGITNGAALEDEFRDPPDSARPGVYWYFMDGNLDQKEMINDLDSMKAAGLGNVVYLEVNVDVPQSGLK